MTRKQLCRYLLSAAVFVLALSFRLPGQTTFGSIVGTIADPTGAPVPEAQVTITNLATNETRSAPTNADGLYQFVNLTPGNYRVQVEKQGFTKAGREPVTVAVQSTARIDVALQVGDVSQTVEVRAETPLIQAEASSLGTVIDQRQVNELPLNGRNPMSLAALSPSVVPQGQSGSTPTGTNPFAWGNYQIGGGLANQSQVYLDGAPVNGAYLNITAMIPTQDSLQEFKVQTNNLSPEFGRFAGGVINFTTKSGSNELHGGAWEFLRNRELNANTFFNNLAGVQRPAFTQNQFGFNLGGPVYIPKLYNGRDKTFFFVNWEGFRLRQGQSFTETVPTAVQRTGDLSSLGVPIYDPLTTCGAAGAAACAPGQTQYNRTAFAGGVIPTTRLNASALRLLNLYPLPNTVGTGNGVNNFVTNASVGGNNNETVVRLDHNIGQSQHLFARYSYWGNLNLPVDPLRNGVCVDRCTEIFNTNNFVMSDVVTISPTTILDLRGSYQRFNYDRTPTSQGFDLTTLGWPASLNTQAFNRALPVPCIAGYDPGNIFCSQGAGSTIVDRNDNYRVAGSLTKIAGNHTVHFGGEFLRATLNYAQTNIPTGIFNFDQNFTASNPLNPIGGSSLASFLLGYPASGSAGTPTLVAAQQFYSGAFLQDDWHVTSRLTLNLGVRWEHSGPWTERHDRLAYFDPTASNPLVNQLGAVQLVNSAANSNRSNINPNWKQFAPRIGFAFQVDPKTVVHAGYGIFWIPNNVAWDYSPNNNPINSYTTQFTSSLNNGLTPFDTLSNPFPNGIIQPPQRNPIYQQTLLGQNVTLPLLSNPYGYAQQWNFDIQRQFGSTFVLDVAYAGSKGTHLPISANINQLPDQYLGLGNQLNNTVANPFSGVVQSGQLSGGTVAAGQLLRPFPQYQSVTYAGEGVGGSSYHSLQVQARKRFSNGASIQLAYTWSKLITNSDTVTNWLENGGGTTYQDWNNLNGERSVSANNVPHRLVVSYVMDVPYGRGRRFGSNVNPWINTVIGDWGVEGVTTIQSGFPLHFSTSQNLTYSFGGGSRPNVGANCAYNLDTPAQQKLGQWFDTSCFAQPAAFTFGNEPRVDPNLQSAGIANWDFSAYKNFPFAQERARIQFRAEFFNIFNRVQFAPPNTQLGTSQFGVVSTQANQPRLVQFALRFLF